MKSRMRQWAVGTTAIVLVCCHTFVAHASCEDDALLMAMRTRMMVSAISCHAPANYNVMVKKHRSVFAAAQRNLIATAGSMAAYDEWITEIANRQGLARAEAKDDGCDSPRKELADVARVKSGGALQAMSRNLGLRYPVIGSCTALKP